FSIASLERGDQLQVVGGAANEVLRSIPAESLEHHRRLEQRRQERDQSCVARVLLQALMEPAVEAADSLHVAVRSSDRLLVLLVSQAPQLRDSFRGDVLGGSLGPVRLEQR